MSTQYSRKNPFQATLSTNKLITLPGSQKETRHFVFSLESSGIKYEMGDSLGVFPKNNEKLVDQLLHHLNFSGQEIVTLPSGDEITIRESLVNYYSITEPDRKFLISIAQKNSEANFLNKLCELGNHHELENYLIGRDIIDFFIEYSNLLFSPQEFIGLLRKLQPRLYSIASSQLLVPNEVHLTIAIVRYYSHNRNREGVCSSLLADYGFKSRHPIFVHVAKHFRLPEDTSASIIMVGPGTGVAPFRGFMQERFVSRSTGKNWLFFGEQHSKTDFLYREEFEEWIKNGTLFRLDTAFSRDQEKKIYVQDRLWEQGKQVFDWLENGSYFYVCGDASRMAKDVEKTLLMIIEKYGNKSIEDATVYLNDLKKAKRYRKDVY